MCWFYHRGNRQMAPVKWTAQASLQTREMRKRREIRRRARRRTDWGKWEKPGRLKEGRGTKMERDVWRRRTDKQWRWEGIKQRRAGQQEGGGGGGRRRRKDRMLTRPLGVWRPNAGRAHARPATRLPLFYFTVWLQRAWEAVGTPTPAPPPSSLITRSINVFMCRRRTDCRTPLVFRCVPVKQRAQWQTSFGEPPSPDFISRCGLFPLSPVPSTAN